MDKLFLSKALSIKQFVHGKKKIKSQKQTQKNKLNYTQIVTAVSCSSIEYKLGGGGNGVWCDGLAGLCMSMVHGVCRVIVGVGWGGWCDEQHTNNNPHTPSNGTASPSSQTQFLPAPNLYAIELHDTAAE